MSKEKKSSPAKWVITVFIITFLLSLLFSFISSIAINELDIIPAILVLILVVLIGIVFDLIGVATTVATEEEFHSMAAKKIPGAKKAISIIRNSPKVSNFCADVIGDICGVLSGALSAMIAIKISSIYDLNFDIQVVLGAIVAAVTVGGKAITKEIAKANPTQIVFFVAKILGK